MLFQSYFQHLQPEGSDDEYCMYNVLCDLQTVEDPSTFFESALLTVWSEDCQTILSGQGGAFSLDYDTVCQVWYRLLPTWRQHQVDYGRCGTLANSDPDSAVAYLYHLFPEPELSDEKIANFSCVIGNHYPGAEPTDMGHFDTWIIPSYHACINVLKEILYWPIRNYDSIPKSVDNTGTQHCLSVLNQSVNLLQEQGQGGSTSWGSRDVSAGKLRNAKRWAQQFVWASRLEPFFVNQKGKLV